MIKSFYFFTYLTITTFFCFITSKSISQISLVWAGQIGGAWYSEPQMTLDSIGNIYTYGYFDGILDADPSIGVTSVQALGQLDFYLSKIDPNGNLLWSKQIGGSNSFIQSVDIAIDNQGNIFIAGLFRYTVDFDPGIGIQLLTSNTSNSQVDDIFILKLNQNGEFQWVKQISGPRNEVITGIELDQNMNPIISGLFGGGLQNVTIDFDPGVGIQTMSSFSGQNFLLKLDSSGDFVWTKQFGGSDVGLGISNMHADINGNLYLSGNFIANQDFDPDLNVVNLIPSGYSSNGFLLKLNSNANFVWVKQFVHSLIPNALTSPSFEPFSIKTDAQENIFISGGFAGLVDFDPSMQQFNLTSSYGTVPSQEDIFILKLNQSGDFEWVKQVTSSASSSDISYSLEIDDVGSTYITGRFRETCDFDPSINNYYLTSQGSADIFLLKLDNLGNFLWAKQFGSIGYQSASSMARKNEIIYLAGGFENTVDFDPNSSVSNLNSNGYDGFIIKLNECVSYDLASINACDSLVWVDGNTYYSNNNTAHCWVEDTTTGCFSFISLDLTMSNSSSSTINATICEGDTYNLNGQFYTTPGQHMQILTNQAGCDSTVTLNLSVNQNDGIQLIANPAFGNAPLNVAFNNQTQNLTNYNFTWYFGDGNFQQSNSPFVSHVYTLGGYIDVTISAENQTTGCISNQTFNDLVYVLGGLTCTHSATINQTGLINSCVGDTIFLSCNEDPSFNYQWNKNGIPISGAISSTLSVVQSGNYTVTIFQNNCPVYSNPISVIFNPLPNIPIITSSGTIAPCSGGSVTLSAPSGYNSYLWSTNSTTESISASQSGNYTVTITDNNGCQRSSNPFTVNASFIPAPDLCIVGIDSLTNENRIVWEKPLINGIDSFFVYKESNVSNVYTKIGGTDYNDLAVFLDVNSNPAMQAYRYKISVLDTCGTETSLGDFHKTIHLTINQGVGNTWNLIWSHYEGINFGSYNIYRGTDPTNISLLTTIQSNLNSYTDLTPPAGAVYYQIEVVNPNSCDPTKILGYDASKSNIVNTQNVGTDLNSFNNTRVYPNPSNGVINIEVDPMLTGQTYELKDNMGRLVVRGFIYNPTEEINIKDLSTGVYLLSISNTSKVLKVIKN